MERYYDKKCGVRLLRSRCHKKRGDGDEAAIRVSVATGGWAVRRGAAPTLYTLNSIGTGAEPSRAEPAMSNGNSDGWLARGSSGIAAPPPK